MKLSAKQTLLLMGTVAVLPVAASYGLYYAWRPDATVNYGALVEPTPLPAAGVAPLAGSTGLDTLRGRWVLLYAGGAQCDEACRRVIYHMRQVRTAQGEHMGRIERAWLVADDGVPDARLLQDYPGMHVLRAQGSQALAALSRDGEAAGRLFLVDPLGNLMLRYPAEPEPKGIIRDLQRLMKYSRLG